MGKSRKVAAAKLPVTIDFTKPGVDFPLNAMKIESRDASGLTMTTTGGDPQIVVHDTRDPDQPDQADHLEADITVPPGQPARPPSSTSPPRFFPTSAPSRAQPCPPVKDGATALATAEMMCWPSYGTPLTKIRIDPCSEPGARVVLRRLVLSGR